MFIYDNSNPQAPVQLGVFQHARACDPVFASGDRAYVTLRDGTGTVLLGPLPLGSVATLPPLQSCG
jgi:hypothetical protein